MARRWLSSCGKRPWFHQTGGLQFECTACGKCCTGSRHDKVWVNAREMDSILEYTQSTDRNGFLAADHEATASSNGRQALQMKDNGECIFLSNRKCTIYPVRPTQCRTYPFWPQNVASSFEWEVAGRLDCEGIRDSNVPTTSVTPETIRNNLLMHTIHQTGQNFTYSEMEELLKEIDPQLLQEFEQDFVKNVEQRILFQDSHLIVTEQMRPKPKNSSSDPHNESHVISRRVCFVETPRLIQSEVFLLPNDVTDEFSRQESNEIVDHGHLTLDVHKAMCLSLAMVDDLSKIGSIAVIGAGAGALPMFLKTHLSETTTLHLIEPNQQMIEIAKLYFGLPKVQTDKWVVYPMTGEDYIEMMTVNHNDDHSAQDKHGSCSNTAGQTEQPNQNVNLVFLDVAATVATTNDSNIGKMAIPPSSMLETSFLEQLNQKCLQNNGILVMNAVLSEEQSRDFVQSQLLQVFRYVRWIELPKNTVFFASSNQFSSVHETQINNGKLQPINPLDYYASLSDNNQDLAKGLQLEHNFVTWEEASK